MNFNSIQRNISIARLLCRALALTVFFAIAAFGPSALAQQVLTPPSISFGNVPLTVPVTQTGTFTNNSTFQPVTITGLSTSDVRFVAAGSGASPCNAGAVVSFGASCTYALTFTPTGTGSFNSTTTVAYTLVSSPLTLTQPSSGTGFIQPATASPPSILFGNVPLTVVATQPFTFTNNSNTNSFPASYTLTGFATTGLGFSAVGSGGTPCAVGLVLPPAASCQGTASFQIGGTGSSNGTITISFQTGQGANPTYNTAFALNGTGFTPPSTLAPPSIAFGNVAVGTPVSQTATFTNNSDTTAYPSTYHVDSLAVSGLGYSVAGSGATPCAAGLMLAPGLSCGFTVTFIPAGPGASGGTVTVGFGAALGTDPPYSQTQGLSGTGVSTPAVSISGSGTFPNTAVGQSSAAQPITITNSGTSTLTLFSFAHTNASVFPDSTGGPPPSAAHWCGIGSSASGAPSTGAPVNLAPGNSCTLNIIFTPNATGPLSGTITINSNAPTSPTAIAVSGNGTAAPGPSMTVSFAPASVLVNAVSVMTLTLTNPSATPAGIGGGSVTLPAGLAATPPGSNSCGTFGSVMGNVYSFGMGSVPAMGSCTIDLSVQSVTASTYTVTIMPGSLSAGAGMNTNTSSAALTVTAAPAGPFAYIANFGSFSGNTVSVIDTPTNTVIATVTVQTGPVATAVNPAGTRAYVSNQQSNSISVIDTSTNTVITSVGVGSQPGEPGISPDGSRVYVPNQTSNNLSVIDTSTNTVVATVGALSFPVGAAVNPGGTKVYVTASGSNTVAIISTATNTLLGSVPVCATPYQPVFNASGTRAYVVCTSGAVSVIDTSSETVIATVTVGANARGIAVHPSGNPAYVSNSGSNSVSVIDTTTNTVSATLPAGNNPWGLALNPSGSRLYVASSNTNAVLVFDTGTNTVVATVPVGVGPIGGGQFIQPAAFTPTALISYSPAGINFGARTVNTTSPTSTITVTNSGSASVFISSIGNTGDFAFTSTCPSFSAPLVPGASCTLSVTFTPLTVSPTLTGAITITSNAANSPNTIPLSGSGTAVAVPNVTLSPTALNFGNQPITTPSAVQSIALTNSGFATLTIATITKTGSSDFARVSPSSPTPDCTTSVAPGATCYISVVFTPSATGAAAAQIHITSNASTSPDIVNVSGNGATATPAIAVPQGVNFGDQVIGSTSTQILSIVNSGSAALNISGITLAGTDAASFTSSGSCSAVAPGSSCDLTITFTPAVVGSKSAQVTIVSDAFNQPSVTVPLTGNGILAPRPIVDLSATVIGYGNAIFGGATPSQGITLTNKGGAIMQILALYTVGDFVQNSNCPANLGSGVSCLINIQFTPRGMGLRTGELVLVTNAQGSPHHIPLSGTGCRWFSQAQSRLFVTLCAN